MTYKPPGRTKGKSAAKETSWHMSAYVSICQHTSAYVRIRQHACKPPGRTKGNSAERKQAGIRQHTSAYVSIRQHTSAYVGIRRHTSSYAQAVSVRTSRPAGRTKGKSAQQRKQAGRRQQRQYLYFCTSKASKLSTWCRGT